MLGLSVATARAMEPREVGLLGLAVILVGAVSMIGSYEVASVTAANAGADAHLALAGTVLRGLSAAVLVSGMLLALPPLGHLLVSTPAEMAQLRLLVRALCMASCCRRRQGATR